MRTANALTLEFIGEGTETDNEEKMGEDKQKKKEQKIFSYLRPEAAELSLRKPKKREQKVELTRRISSSGEEKKQQRSRNNVFFLSGNETILLITNHCCSERTRSGKLRPTATDLIEMHRFEKQVLQHIDLPHDGPHNEHKRFDRVNVLIIQPHQRRRRR
jgi:hypothetical protein